jgi:ATP-dependent Zn protease
MIQQSLSVALMYAFEHHRERVNWDDMREAMANIEAGLAEPVKYTAREALATARHELGHAVANRFFLPEMKSVRLSIRKRGGALGHHQAVEAEEMFSKFRGWLAGDIRWALGSIAVERVFYDENSQGVSHDLQSATQTAARMVGLWGMGPDARSDEEGLRAQVIGERLVSKAAAMESMTESSAYVDAWRLMVKNKEAIDRLAHELVEKQELVGKEVDALLDTAHLQAPDGAAGWPDFLFSLDGGQHLCPRCHRLLPEGARYCINCGESLFSPLNPAQTSVKT